MSASQSGPMKKSRRAFVGNLRQHPNLEDKLRDLFAKSAIPIPVDGIQIVALKQPGDRCFALVKCDVEMAVKCINGITFVGNILEVKYEKKQNQVLKKMKSMGFGGWAKPSSSFAAPITTGKKSLEKKDKNVDDKMTVEKKLSNVDDGAMLPNMEKLSLGSTEKDSDDLSQFSARCKLPLGNLMDELGAHEPDYEKMKNMKIENSSSPAEKGSKKSSKSDGSTVQHHSSGALAPNGKAPIHIELVSFGFKYSVPPQAREGWSHSNPLSPIDCRDLPRCPHYVAKLSGLSYKVKRTMLSMRVEEDEEGDIDNDTSAKDEKHGWNGVSDAVYPMVVKSEEMSLTIFSAIEEAIRCGGHGYAFPLEAKIHIGSEYGRHRSVVLCEKLAQMIRTLLRQNEGSRIRQPVSVSTRHRDVDNNHRDEEAFGTDLRREHEVEVKRKKKHEWLESKW